MKKGTVRLAAYSVSHFAVDFTCAFIMFAFVKKSGLWTQSILIYNFCAFALQMPFGLLADKLNKNGIAALVGCALVGISLCFGSLPVIAAFAAGVGNALFHVGGGIDVLNMSDKKAALLGIFVSPGALGIFFGGMLASQDGSYVLPAAVLAASAVLIVFTCFADGVLTFSANAPISAGILSDKKDLLKVLALFAVVAVRSYAGMIMTFEWKNGIFMSVLAIIVVVLGKTTGGFISDRTGSRLLCALSLGSSCVLFVFADLPAAGLIAIFLFNMTMPVTLFELSRIMPSFKGFSFGILTFALFLGFLPAYFGVRLPFDAKYMLAVLSALSLILMYPSCARRDAV